MNHIYELIHYDMKRQRVGAVIVWILSYLTVKSLCQCPPPVGQFITLNGETYRDSGALIKARKETRAVVARLGVKPNEFYSSPKCSVLEDARNDLYSNFGVKEEYDPGIDQS